MECSDLENAISIFNNIEKKNVISYGAIIKGFNYK